jgi:hypothetical protein
LDLIGFTALLKAKGRSLKDIGVNELALSRNDTLQALMTLEGSSIPILGGDVLRLKAGKITRAP